MEVNQGGVATSVPVVQGDSGQPAPSATFQFGETQQPSTPDFGSVIPEAYKEKEWVKNIVNAENQDKFGELFNQFENAQKLIGQKSQGLQVPDDKATPEQVKAFHKALGVPEKAEQYELKAIEWDQNDPAIKEAGTYLNEIHNDAFTAKMKQAALDLGLTPKQFQGIAEAHARAFVDQHKEMAAKLQQSEIDLNKNFDELINETFGDRKDQVLANGKKLLDQTIPKDGPLRKMLNEMSNEQLVVLAAALDGTTKTYIKEDSLLSSGSPSSPGAMTKEAHRAKGVELMSSKAFQDPMHPEHTRYVQMVNEHYANMPPERAGR